MTFPSKNRKNYLPERVLQSLGRKGVVIEGHAIDLTYVSHLGIKSLGKLDYLLRHAGYYIRKGWKN